MTEILNTCKRLEEIIKSKINIQAIILGTIHTCKPKSNVCDKEYNCYKEIIENIKPDFVLVEATKIIEDIIKNIEHTCILDKDNNDISKNWHSYVVDMGIESEIIIKKRDFCFKLILCDLSDKEKNDVQKNLLNRLPEELTKCEYDFDAFYENHPELNLKRLFYNEREKRMGENVIKYLDRKSIIVLIGHEHAGECSNIHNILKDINYIALWRNNKYCGNCGQKIAENNENENCDYCGNVLYNFIINNSK
ncbi:MAG: hypothetical protein Q7J35_18625 [Candidatus Methanoperedens sp.]|nr:hypothetical protein [Candidatus Methanoperedens sp.]